MLALTTSSALERSQSPVKVNKQFYVNRLVFRYGYVDRMILMRRFLIGLNMSLLIVKLIVQYMKHL